MVIVRILLLALALSSLAGRAAAGDLRQDVSAFAARFGWPGVVALEVGPEGVRQAIVRGDCLPGRPLTIDTPMMVGSVSKAFTGRAILALARRRQLDLDAPMARGWPTLGPAGNLTARQLLTHTSGFTARQGMAIVDTPDTNLLEPKNAPGPRRYSNLNYSLLGALAAHQESASFDTALHALVAKPDGLSSLAVAGDAARACGHTLAFGAVIRRPEPAWSPWAAPAGFLQVSPADLARLETRILRDPEAGRSTPLDPLIGWKRADIAGEPVFSHSGQIGGARATLVVLPRRDAGLVIVVNRGGDFLQDPVDQVALRNVARLQGRPTPSIPWPWERLVRFAALLLLAHSGRRLSRTISRADFRALLSWRASLATVAAIAVPMAALNITELTAASLWRIAPDMFLLLVLGPIFALSHWVLRRRTP